MKLISTHHRQILIDRVLSIPNPLDEAFYKIWNDLSIIKCDVYSKDGKEFIYYNSNKEWIFYQYTKNDEFWCEYDRIWELFKKEFKMDDIEIQAFIWCIVSEALKKEVGTPKGQRRSFLRLVSEALKKEVGTPGYDAISGGLGVSEALKKFGRFK